MRIIINARLGGANEYTLKCRSGPRVAASYKQKQEKMVKAAVLAALHHKPVAFEHPVFMKYLWVEPNKKRDKDNIAFAKKFVQDALVQVGLLKGDGWKYIVGFTDNFAVDKENPRVELEITEVID